MSIETDMIPILKRLGIKPRPTDVLKEPRVYYGTEDNPVYLPDHVEQAKRRDVFLNFMYQFLTRGR